jgi:hypothetical protein
MEQALLSTLLIINQILNAGNTITAFSLLLYALTFNLRERVARTFALLMACVTAVFFFDALVQTGTSGAEQGLWLRLQWMGISFLPAAYLHFSDALLESTGRPSLSRRRIIVRLGYVLSAATFVVAGLTHQLAGELVHSGEASYLRPGPLFYVYCLFMLGSLAISGLNFWRAYRRCLTGTSKRRMSYLILGSLGPMLGSFPFLMLLGGWLSSGLPYLFWALLMSINAAVTILLVMMAYAVAYFGVNIPDRVVKSRLFQWILRGPVVASTVLAATIVVNRLGRLFGAELSRASSFIMVGSILLLQYVITLIQQPLERWFFYGSERDDIQRLHLLQERLLTTADLRQFLESIANAVCDIAEVSSAFVAVMGDQGLELEVAVGPEDPLRGSRELPPFLMNNMQRSFETLGTVFSWDVYWLIPLHTPESGEVIGLLGMRSRGEEIEFTPAEEKALTFLAERAATALSNRLLQREVFRVVDRLMPQFESFHQIRSAGRYASTQGLTLSNGDLSSEAELSDMVKDALAHYWGGPRLTESPLLRLRVVLEAMAQHDGNPVNALRDILRRAIEQVRPEGERRFTAEWMLYNILEMKFLEGRKVRDVAMRLAMSEADLYRKQRVAIEAVARAVAEMERQATVRAANGAGA